MHFICSMDFPGGSVSKESCYNAGDLDSIPGLGRSPGEGKGYPLQYSDLENTINCIVQGEAKCQTWLNNIHFTSGRWRNEKSRKQTQRLCMVSYYLCSVGSIWPFYFCFKIFRKHKEIEKTQNLLVIPSFKETVVNSIFSLRILLYIYLYSIVYSSSFLVFSTF